MTETNSDESLQVLLRLLIDEIVEDLSRTGSERRNRSVQNQTLHGRCCVVLGSLEGIPQRQSWSREIL
jgi:hypothetical protein